MSDKPRPKSASNLEDSDTELLDKEISLNPKFIRTAKFKSTTDLTKKNSPNLNVERSTSESNVLITQNPLKAKTVGKPASKTRGKDLPTGRFISIPIDGQSSPGTSKGDFLQLFDETFSKKSPAGLIKTIDQSRASDSDSEEDSNDNQTLSRQLPFHSYTYTPPQQVRQLMNNPLIIVNNPLNQQGAAAAAVVQQQGGAGNAQPPAGGLGNLNPPAGGLGNLNPQAGGLGVANPQAGGLGNAQPPAGGLGNVQPSTSPDVRPLNYYIHMNN